MPTWGKRTGAGRPKGAVSKSTAEIKALAGKHTPEALKTLVSVMKGSESDAARVAAAKELQLKVPLVVRLEGTNVDKGKKLLAASGLKITAADDLGDAAKKIVAAI